METYVVKLPVLFQRRAQAIRQQGQNIRAKAAVCVGRRHDTAPFRLESS